MKNKLNDEIKIPSVDYQTKLNFLMHELKQGDG